MPIYEFRCSACGHQFEELILGGAEVRVVRCPRCLNEGAEKLLSVFSSGRASTNSSSASGCAPSGSRFS